MGMRGDGIIVYLRLSRTYFRYTTLIYKFTDEVSEEKGEDFFFQHPSERLGAFHLQNCWWIQLNRKPLLLYSYHKHYLVQCIIFFSFVFRDLLPNFLQCQRLRLLLIYCEYSVLLLSPTTPLLSAASPG